MSDSDRHRRGDPQLLATLAAGATQAEAAEAARVSERTVRRRLEEPEFRQQLAALRGEMLQRTCGLLASGAADAVLTLRALLDSSHDGVRLGAARAILATVTTMEEVLALDERIRTLEGRMMIERVET